MLGVEVDRDSLRKVTTGLKQASDGKELRKEMARELRAALKPAVSDARSAVMTIPSSGAGRQSPGLRQGIAKRIGTEIRLSGKSTGAKVKARRTPNLRGFDHAPKRTQSRRGWRHPTFGRDTWVTQRGRRRWFDDSTKKHSAKYRAAVKAVIDDFADRLAKRMG